MSTITRESISSNNTDPAVTQVASIVSLLQKAVKIVCLYPPINPSCAKAISLFTDEITAFLQDYEQLPLYLSDEGFTYEGESVEPTFGDSHRLSKICYDAGVSEFVFSTGFESESSSEIFEIFRRVISKDEGDFELGEALWGREISGFHYEIVEDQSYLEFDRELHREFFDEQGEALESGHLSDSDSGKDSYQSAFDDPQIKDEDASKRAEEQSKSFESLVTTLADDAGSAEAVAAAKEDSSVQAQDLLMRVYELDNKEAHETAMTLAKDAMFNSNDELIGIINDLLEQDKILSEFTDTVLACVKTHSYFVEEGDLSKATSILRTLQKRRLEVRQSSPNWETVITDALLSVASRERVRAVCDILNDEEEISSVVFSDYLSTFDWTSYSILTEALGILEHMSHRMALCEFLAKASPEHVDLLASGLYDKRWYVARNTAIILSNFNCSRSHKHLLKAMKHSEPRVRIEVLRGCIEHEDDYKSSILLQAITDSDSDIQHLAIKSALEQSGSEAFSLFDTLLNKLLVGKISESASFQIIAGYSNAGQNQAVHKLSQIAGDWKLFGHSQFERFRSKAIEALQENASDEAELALKQLSKSWCKEIKSMSLKALKNRVSNQREQ